MVDICSFIFLRSRLTYQILPIENKMQLNEEQQLLPEQIYPNMFNKKQAIGMLRRKPTAH